MFRFFQNCVYFSKIVIIIIHFLSINKILSQRGFTMENNLPDLIIYNIGTLITMKGHSKKPKTGSELDDIGIVNNDLIACNNGEISYIGNRKDFEESYKIDIENIRTDNIRTLDVGGDVVMPGFIDSHTHLVFGGSRENEFDMKLKGSSYIDILKNGGGILSTVEATRKASKKELLKKAEYFASDMIEYGTTTVEIKSGYGLNPETELKMLEVINDLKNEVPINIYSTYLGAHTIPNEYKNDRKAYVKQVMNTLPKAKEYADFCDVFCEEGAFTVDETRLILNEAKKLGYKLKIHTNQFTEMGGEFLASELGVISADHLDHLSEDGVKSLKQAGIIAVTLPGVPYHLMTGKYSPLRKMIEAGLPVAIATDFNPGSCPSYNMQAMMSLACRNQKISINEVLSMATINSAHALGIADITGSIETGKQADIIILDSKDYRSMIYHFGINHIHETIIKGNEMCYQIEINNVV